jgi:hypothetical protein
MYTVIHGKLEVRANILKSIIIRTNFEEAKFPLQKSTSPETASLTTVMN